MSPRRHSAAALLAATLLAAPAPAQELVLGLGSDDATGKMHPALLAEYRFAPFATLGPVAFGAGLAAEADADGDFWGGGGLTLAWPFADRWRLEASVMAGGYAQGSDDDLGSDFPMFRSQIGASVALSPAWRAGLAINHKSNASTAPDNPGIESVYLTFARAL